MNEQIYYADGNQRRGPFTLEQIRSFNLQPNTLIWYKGLSEWTPICQAPLTASYYMRTPAYQTPGYGYQQQGAEAPPKPNTYMVWSILTTIFCCLIFGIISIVYASKVDTLYYAGRYDEAEEASRKAKNWAIWSAVSSIILGVIYVIAVGGAIGLAYL